jgi:hypothetical protein
VALLVLVLPPVFDGRPSASAGPARSGSAPALASAPQLSASPSTWWMIAGSAVTVRAAWVDVPPGCNVTPEWFVWSLGPGGAEGNLSAGNGSEVNFSADSVVSGTTQVLVRSAATVACEGNGTGVVGVAASNLTVDAPLLLRNLTVAPDPLDPGANASVRGWVTGGEPPYSVEVDWGGGNLSSTNLTMPGAFSLDRPLAAGTYLPTVFVEDAIGDRTDGTVGETVNASSGFAAAIVPSTLVAEVGVPVRFAVATVNAPPAGYSSVFACGDTAPATEPAGLACTFEEPGSAPVSFEGVEAAFPYAEATASLEEPVVPAFSLVLGGPAPVAEAGELAYVALTLAGGVPPFLLSWHIVGNDTDRSTTIDSDGTVYLPVLAATAGEDLLSVAGVDTLGAIAPDAEESLDVEPALAAGGEALGTVGPAGVTVSVSGSVEAGSPPFAWSIAPADLSPNVTALSGTLPEPGPFGWTGIYSLEGELAVELTVADGTGATWSTLLTVPLAPVLSVNSTFSLGGAHRLEATVDIAGGAPPFSYRIDGSDGESWNGTVGADGPFSWEQSTAASGPLTLTWTFTDAYGRSVTGEAQLTVPGAPAASTSLEGAGVTAGLLGGILGAVGVGLWTWRKSRRPPPPTPDPTETLRAILEPADGADRAVVELEAEEAGVPFPVVRATLDRLIERGAVRAERGADGEEVLAWERGAE